jgi:phosphotransferase system enzyme I (PtsI)
LSFLRGESVAPGIAVGPVHLQGFDLPGGSPARIAADEVEAEMNRLHTALQRSRAQIEEIKQKQAGTLGESELRIFDTHIAYLADPMFVTEIEEQIVQERFSVSESVRMVVDKYDRIFQLVESDLLRKRASDLRDVATRLQRNLDAGSGSDRPLPQGRYILVAKKLATADMFNLQNERVDGIVAEEGGMSSHAAILARGMGIPTITGIRDLSRKLRDGGVVIVDATHGELHVDATESVLGDYTERAAAWQSEQKAAPTVEPDAHKLRCGTAVQLYGSCGSGGEAELSRTFGLSGVGVFRTELAYLIEGRTPSEDELVEDYRKVIEAQDSRPVHFRLLDVAASTLEPGRAVERNPAMGNRGVRGLLQNQTILRQQLRALLRAAAGTTDTAVLVPFVTSLNELQRVKAVGIEERVALRKRGEALADRLLVAPIIEVPAAALGIGAILTEADFAVVAIDDLQAHLMAADRDNPAVRDYHSMAHPALFDLLHRMARDAEQAEKELVLFGEAAADPIRMPFYLGAGYRRFSIAPVRLRGLLSVFQRYSLDECQRIASRIMEAPRTLDVQKVLVDVDVG